MQRGISLFARTTLLSASRVFRYLSATAILVAAFVATSAAASSTALGGDIVANVPANRPLVDLGPANPGGTINISIMLNYRNYEAGQRLILSQNNPHSPLFRRFLSNDQFNAAFAPTAADYARAIAYLRMCGLQITQTYQNRSLIQAAGSVSNVSRLLGTSIHFVGSPSSNVRHFMNVTPAHEPLALRGLLFSVLGLENVSDDDFRRYHASTQRSATNALTEATGLSVSGPFDSLGPLAFTAGYLFPIQFAPVYDGSGRSSGIVASGDFLDSDLDGYLKYFNIIQTGPATRRVLIDGGPDPSAGYEATGDAEILVSTAPGTALYIYEYPNVDGSKDLNDAFMRVVNDNVVDTLSISQAVCEAGVNSDYIADWNQAAYQGALKGITFIASSGDYGAGNAQQSLSRCKGAVVEAPASSPYFAAVGGTSLTVNQDGSWVSEVGWNDNPAIGASGGGVSKAFPELPPWQANIPGIIPTGRNLPDVSLDAGTHAAILYNGQWEFFAGTSLAAPLFNAEVTEADQFLELQGDKRLGLVAMFLDKTFLERGYGIDQPYFHDIVSGCNTYNGVQGYCARPGYDQVTGIGSPVWQNLLLPQLPFQTLYQFGGPEFTGLVDGNGSQARLLYDNGAFYGTTAGGGAGGCGTVFEFIPPLTEKVLYSFTGGSDGCEPLSDLIDVNGYLYGTTYYGGAGGSGTIFSFNTRTGVPPSIIHNFSKGDGQPGAGLTKVGTVLYGTTEASDTSDGIIFSINASGGGYKVRHIFHQYQFDHDGTNPHAGLIQVGEDLYGTTEGGGTENAGTIFKISTDGSGEVVLHNFGETRYDGEFPEAPLLSVNGQTLFGTTNRGGSVNAGTIFAIDPLGANYRMIHAFTGNPDGSAPMTGLIDVGGRLYGTTQSGGVASEYGDCFGTIYRIDESGAGEKILQTFYDVPDGNNPIGGLLQLNGALYGTTQGGGNGQFGAGTIYRFTP